MKKPKPELELILAKLIDKHISRIEILEVEIKRLLDCNQKLETKLTVAKVKAEKLKAIAESEFQRGSEVHIRHMG